MRQSYNLTIKTAKTEKLKNTLNLKNIILLSSKLFSIDRLLWVKLFNKSSITGL